MTFIIVIVFIAVFAVAALVLFAGQSTASKETERTIATLQTAIAAASYRSKDPGMDVRKEELFSELPPLNRWLMRLEFAPRLRMLLYQADLDWTVGGLLMMSTLCWLISAYLIYLRCGLLFVSLSLGLIVGAVPIGYVFQKRSKRFYKFEEGFAGTLDLMVSALRAGHSLVSALEIAATESPDPIRRELRICFDEQNYGLDLKTAMGNLVTRVPLHDLRLVVTAILIQRESGGNLAEVFDKAAYLIRERFRLKKQVRIHTAQGRLTGWILSFLPIVLGIGLYLVNPKYMSLLWTRATGIKLLYTAGLMMIAGALIIRKIVSMEV